ncbi:MAG: FHA domain-containing protein [Anaerolineales bacterium]|nr:FHA domain-containing protein [Anaerolineales bacterium]
MTLNSDEIPVLVGYQGQLDGQRWMLKGSLVIGRDPDCDISIPNRQVSRRHARISVTPGGVTIEDLGSKNGTHCNGHSLVATKVLSDGDVIQIALAQNFVYLSADATLPLDIEETISPEPETGRLRLDKRARRVWINQKEVVPPLSVSQYRLLELLYERHGRLVAREELVAAVWDEEDATGVSEQALDALVRRLRDRLASVDPRHSYIITVRGHGFRLDNPRHKD